MNTVYEGTLTGTFSNGVAEVKMHRVMEHACHCDECKELDAQDIPFMELCARYLNREIEYGEFRLGMVQRWCEPQGSCRRTFDTNPCSLADAAEEVLFEAECTFTADGRHIETHGALKEPEFRERLRALIHGYQIRQRTVHKWVKGNK